MVAVKRVLKKTTMAAAVGATLLAMASPALAEGKFASSFTGWAGGKESRSWKDSQADGAASQVRLAKCSWNGPGGAKEAAPVLALWHEVGGLPDDKVGGNKGFYGCGKGDVTNSWGKPGWSGNYHFTLQTQGADWYRYSAGWVGVWY
ncbi:hypothetical protein [Streptomyces sp. NPDC059009]|uniref:hypothetical protein n=1 Tax=Streptomyces sp. NPDC059009 TaxID=3346694 RepID=UPI0036C30AF4